MTVLSLSNHWPRNRSICFKEIYAKPTTKELSLPYFLSKCSQDLLIQNQGDFRQQHFKKWFRYLMAMQIFPHSKINIQFFPTSNTPKMQTFSYISPHNWKWIWPHCLTNLVPRFRFRFFIRNKSTWRVCGEMLISPHTRHSVEQISHCALLEPLSPP